jgi:death-on-curing protein
MILYLTAEEILILHYKIIEDFGGSHGVRDENRLKSVEGAPAQVVFGQELYKTIYAKAAVYIRVIIGDHPFSDGNKRTGITAGAVFLIRNKITLTASPNDLEDFAVKVATDHLDIPEIAAWLKANSKTSK